MPDWNNSNVAGHTRLEPKMRQIRQYKKGEEVPCFSNNYLHISNNITSRY